jgi:hypothetical protein
MPAPPSYSAVRTLLRILEEKRDIRHEQEGTSGAGKRWGSGQEIFCAAGSVCIVASGEIVPAIAWAAPLEKLVCNDSREPPH